MRPVNRGSEHAHPFESQLEKLRHQVGPFCSYCEHPDPRSKDHIRPKHRYPELEFVWENLLLACDSCNGLKGDRDVVLEDIYLPDRDNTYAAFVYPCDGSIRPRDPDDRRAINLLDLLGMLEVGDHPDLDAFERWMKGKLRNQQRATVWGIACDAKRKKRKNASEQSKKSILKTVRTHGHFSIWMTVFHDDPEMLVAFIHAFPGTALECFDDEGGSKSPRPPNGRI
jgi:uncharacterized protein (TIGR02646 family)